MGLKELLDRRAELADGEGLSGLFAMRDLDGAAADGFRSTADSVLDT
jgi:hypothetical protein